MHACMQSFNFFYIDAYMQDVYIVIRGYARVHVAARIYMHNEMQHIKTSLYIYTCKFKAKSLQYHTNIYILDSQYHRSFLIYLVSTVCLSIICH